MEIHLLHLLVVAPILYLGISLMAEETLIGSDYLPKLLNNDSTERAQKLSLMKSLKIKRLDDLMLVVVVLVLVLTLVTIVALKYAKVPFLLLISLFGAAILIQQRKLQSVKDAWRKNLDGELPGLLQMLTLMISSGIAPLRAIEIVSQRCESNLSAELGILIDQIKSGDSSSQALDDFAKRIDTLDSRRFSNAISMALERGSPLVPVLTSLVGDARNEEKMQLLRRAGKSEIALMIPVVFLLLPISVVFALYPSFTNMQMF
jgi:tight adherence protein C